MNTSKPHNKIPNQNEKTDNQQEFDKNVEELLNANRELQLRNEEKAVLTSQLLKANELLIKQNKDKHKRIAELLDANNRLLFLNIEKAKQAKELLEANLELAYQNSEKAKRAEELLKANVRIARQNAEKSKRATELLSAYQELEALHIEKSRQAKRLLHANKKMALQNEEIDQNATELLESNRKLSIQIAQNAEQMILLQSAKEEIENSRAIIADNLKYTRILLESSLDPLMVIDAAGYLTDVNLAAEMATGLPREKLIQTFFGDYFIDMEKARTAHALTFLEGTLNDVELQMKNADGKLITVLLNGSLYRNDAGMTVGLFVARNVSVAKEYERELLEYKNNLKIMVENRAIELVSSQQYFEFVFNTIPDATMIFERSTGKIIAVNDSFTEIFGYTRKQALDKTILELSIYNELAVYLRVMKKFLKLGVCINEEVVFLCQDGSTFVGLVSIKGVIKDGVACISSYIRDITEQKTKEKEALFIANHDHLTGLYNRHFFESELRRLDHMEFYPLTIIVGDINGLRMINDAFGNQVGDYVITEIAGKIRSCCSDDDVLARIGGDAFACLIPHMDEKQAYEKLIKIQIACERCETPYLEKITYSNFSLGFATKVSTEEDINDIVKLAEDHMHHRKMLEHRSSRNAIIASIKATMVERDLQTELHAERLITYSRKIGEAINLSASELDKLELLATLHDIGKVGIDNAILLKPGPLTDKEWITMRKHPEMGYRIAMSTPELVPIAEMILFHHERWDGTGYPQKISGEKIPSLSRIIAIVDAYDAMTSDRPYRLAMDPVSALAELRRCSGTQFDPKLVDVFLKVVGSE
jgi:diguanylate cyclase (GGDEF)-like protein/PAS domain S-box-containing protein